MGLQMMKCVQGGFLFCDRWSLLEKKAQEDLYICINYSFMRKNSKLVMFLCIVLGGHLVPMYKMNNGSKI